MNVKISDPEIINFHIRNCTDFHKKLTDFSAILDEYPDETVMCNVYKYCEHKTDSIYAESDFFTQIHDDNLSISENIEGGTTELKNNDVSIAKLYGTLNDDEFLVLDPDGNPQFNDDSSQVLVETRTRQTTDGDSDIKTDQSWKDIEPLGDDQVNLSATTGLKSLKTWFVMYWLERYRVAHYEVKKAVEENLGDNMIFYKKFSESVGSLKNIEFIKQNHTLPLDDFDSEANDIPYSYTGTLNYIMTDNEKRVALALSKHTNKLFRKNSYNLQYDAYAMSNNTPESKDSHAINLVTDTKHYERMEPIKGDIHTVLQTELQNMYDVLLFISNNVNTSKIPAVVYKSYVEGMMVDVDLLKNKAKKLMTGLKNDYLLKVSSS